MPRTPARGPGLPDSGAPNPPAAQNALAVDPFGSRMDELRTARPTSPGIKSDAISLFNKQLADNPEVGTIVLHRIAGVEGTSVSVTSRPGPQGRQKGVRSTGLPVAAEKQAGRRRQGFRKSRRRLPQICRRMDEPGQGARREKNPSSRPRAAFQKSHRVRPKAGSPHTLELGLLCAKDANWPGVRQVPRSEPSNSTRSTSRRLGTPTPSPTITSSNTMLPRRPPARP